MNILIAHNFSDFSYADTSRQLALKLASEGHQVVFFSHSDPVVAPAIAGLTIMRWPEQRPTGFASFKAVYRAMKAHHIEVVLAHAAALNITGLAALLAGVRNRIGYYHSAYESTLIDNQNNGLSTRVKRLRKQLFYRCYTQMVCVSHFAAGNLHQWFQYPMEQTVVIPNALADRNSANSLYAKPPAMPLVFFAPGRLEPGKNTMAMAKGFIAFAKQYPGKVLLNIAGTGPLAAEVTKLCADNPSIHYLGQLPYLQVDGYIRDAHVVVCSTLAEAFGMSIVEAMMQSTPVLASAVGGPAEIVTHTKNGWLVNGSSPEIWQMAFEQTFQFFHHQPLAYDGMRAFGRETFVRHYQQSKQIASLEKLLISK